MPPGTDNQSWPHVESVPWYCFRVCTNIFPRWRFHLVKPNKATSSAFESIFASYSRDRSRDRGIADDPEGFDRDDILWAASIYHQNTTGLKAFLAPGDFNQAHCYHVSLAYLKPSSHAAIILRDDRSNADTPFETIYRDYEHSDFSGTQIRRLHLRFSEGVDDTMALVLSPQKTTNMRFSRYHELYRVCMTERRLRHIALQSCPDRHEYVTNDCATFALNFLAGLLTYLESQGTIPGIEPYMNRLLHYNHLYGGVLGATEIDSRQNEALGECGNMIVESSYCR